MIKWILIAAITLTAPFAAQAATLHLLTFGNTLDQNIGESVALDLGKWEAEMEKAASYAGMEIAKVSLNGEQFERGSILSALESFEPGAEDAVVIYFSGHGYRSDSPEDNRWPNIAMHDKWEGINQFYLTQLVMEKNPRFILSLSDTCNNVIPSPFTPYTIKFPFFGPSEKTLSGGYKKLFAESEGLVIASASSPGRYAYCDMLKGGHFTAQLIESLQTEVKKQGGGSWHTILMETQTLLWNQQKPQFLILSNKEEN